MKPYTVIIGTLIAIGLSAAVLLMPTASSKIPPSQATHSQPVSERSLEVATFAGGCFWCVEAAFEKVPGVAEVISGYTGGEEVSPTYQQVASGKTGHTEAVQVYYDSALITYEGLLETLWRTANPTDNAGQYVDRGQQYRPEIFYHNESQKLLATISKEKLNDSGRYKDPVVISISSAGEFYPAEEYHQDYYKKNPVRYKFYTRNSGRYQFIDSIWAEKRAIDYANYQPVKAADKTLQQGATSMSPIAQSFNRSTPFDATGFIKPSAKELKKSLSSVEYKVTQKDGTERAFSNPLHNENRTGLYVDIVSGEPLFSSSDKFDSGTGWPSFVRPLDQGVVVEKDDHSLFGVRTEIRSTVADSHLGHVFSDGPAPTGQRYCMNAAAMRFIPLEQMLDSGYGAFIERVSS